MGIANQVLLRRYEMYGDLPFTGSVLTLPLAFVGLVLSVGGWLIGRRDRSVEA